MEPAYGYVEKLFASLGHQDPTIRRRSVWLLGKMRVKAAVLPLIQCLYDNADDPYILADIAQAPGEIGDARAVTHLVSLLHNSFLPARLAAAKALGKLGGSRAREAITAALTDRNQVVRNAAAEALHKLDFKKSLLDF